MGPSTLPLHTFLPSIQNIKFNFFINHSKNVRLKNDHIIKIVGVGGVCKDTAVLYNIINDLIIINMKYYRIYMNLQSLISFNFYLHDY